MSGKIFSPDECPNSGHPPANFNAVKPCALCGFPNAPGESSKVALIMSAAVRAADVRHAEGGTYYASPAAIEEIERFKRGQRQGFIEGAAWLLSQMYGDGSEL